jgi:thiamine pyrophosphate-dependent acetolactate synthase large subunit-like protein
LADCTDEQAARNTLEQALAAPGCALIRCPIEHAEFVLPMVPPGAANVDAIDRIGTGSEPAEEARHAAVA